jgi:DNA helicase-2/ATP-dependent DNA helicase PcrA
MEEERRLLYVGITRAKDRLYLLRAIQRGGRGAAEETYPSRFLDDIPSELLAGQTRTGRTLRGAPAQARWSLASPHSQADLSRGSSDRAAREKGGEVRELIFRAGTRVRHPMWGDGIILNSKFQDDDEIVDVVFESVGIKRLAASLANLTILK